MSNPPPPPAVGAAVQPATGQVMAWIAPAGQLAHLVPLPPARARDLASQLLAAAEAAEQIEDGDHQ
ncbi:hypothetical protein LP52_17935 [Streptomonospora alba]|uniref:Uncharacterized protein n=1 Tax=Streptomonospora alba TaxID=183763 RepID=A0A0C2JFB6_9ACTN|nr:hypothetical protein [Streptomonospora alba]KIH97600.1 hypothetical protein LP52_17935 [Streptomonospora alba]